MESSYDFKKIKKPNGGEEYFRLQMLKDRERVIRYAYRKMAPIIDTTITNYNHLLSTNSYQKASWFLHMLREKIGDILLIESLQEYYRNFRNSTALTSDFQQVVEKVSDQKLDTFFYQWLYQPGFPKIKMVWKQKRNKEIVLKFNQVQKNYLFNFPLEIGIQFSNGTKTLQTIEIRDWETKINLPLNDKIESILLDPAVKLLFEEIH